MSARALDDERWSWATVSPAEAAEMLAIPYDSVLDAIHRGELPHVRIGRRIHLPVPALKTALLIEVAT